LGNAGKTVAVVSVSVWALHGALYARVSAQADNKTALFAVFRIIDNRRMGGHRYREMIVAELLVELQPGVKYLILLFLNADPDGNFDRSREIGVGFCDANEIIV
jgi:hypothetical protein